MAYLFHFLLIVFGVGCGLMGCLCAVWSIEARRGGPSAVLPGLLFGVWCWALAFGAMALGVR